MRGFMPAMLGRLDAGYNKLSRRGHIYPAHMSVTIRRAVTRDVPGIRRLIDTYSVERRLLSKATVALYEAVPEFVVVVRDSDAALVGCGALHVMWEDLAEIR